MRQRLERHLLTQLVALGDHTITGLLCTAGRQALDWSADYRMYSHQRIDPEKLFSQVRSCLLAQTAEQAPAVVALDDTRIRKSGRKVAGASYTRDPLGPPFQVNFIWAQRFVGLSLATGEEQAARMVPIGWKHAPVPPKPKKQADEAEWKSYRERCHDQSLGAVAVAQLRQTRTWLDENGHQQRDLWCVVDGGYTNRTVLKNLPEKTVLVGRIRADAKLHYLPETNAHTGRRRIYGELAPTPEQLRQQETTPWQNVTVWIGGTQHQVRVKTLGPLRWRATGAAHNLKLLVIAPLRYRTCPSGKILYRKPAYLICTNPEADTTAIIQRYILRWDIEVNFRDEKTLLGLGEAQVRHPQAVEKVTAIAVAAYALLLAAAHQTLPETGSFDLPRPRWQRRQPHRATTQQLIQQIRFELWGYALSFSHFVSTRLSSRSPENSLRDPYHAVSYASRHS
jgi:hypothetical protein